MGLLHDDTGKSSSSHFSRVCSQDDESYCYQRWSDRHLSINQVGGCPCRCISDLYRFNCVGIEWWIQSDSQCCREQHPQSRVSSASLKKDFFLMALLADSNSKLRVRGAPKAIELLAMLQRSTLLNNICRWLLVKQITIYAIWSNMLLQSCKLLHAGIWELWTLEYSKEKRIWHLLW